MNEKVAAQYSARCKGRGEFATFTSEDIEFVLTDLPYLWLFVFDPGGVPSWEAGQDVEGWFSDASTPISKIKYTE